MAKMFYTLDEAKAVLGKNEEEIKQLTREGKLREFRDGPRLMFKANQVDTLKAELEGGGGQVDLGPSDSGMAISLSDSKTGGSGLGGSGLTGVGSGLAGGMGGGAGSGGSGLTLSDSGISKSPSGGMGLKEDTALAADLGLSGSQGGVPSPTRSGTGTGIPVAQGSRVGIDVFQNEDIDRADPASQTAISQGTGEQNIDAVGSGSGLLDLTRESDDTSLGAELLDEIAPGGTGSGMRKLDSAAGASGTGAGMGGTGMGGSASSVAGLVDTRGVSAGRGGGPIVYEEKPDPMAPAFAGAALGATIVVILGVVALSAGVVSSSVSWLDTVGNYGLPIVAAGGLVVAGIFFVAGMVMGKSAR